MNTTTTTPGAASELLAWVIDDMQKWEDEAPRPDEWNPIETAPSGKMVILLLQGGRNAPGITVGVRSGENSWYFRGETKWNYDISAEGSKPTHWIPVPDLPEPPK